MNKKLKLKNIIKDKGITLIALVITIIILIILAGVSINLVFDNDGIINKSKRAKMEYEIAADIETLQLEYAKYLMEGQEGVDYASVRISKIKSNYITFLEYLEKESYIVTYDDDTKEVGTVTLNGRVYTIDSSERLIIEYLSEADGTASLMPRISDVVSEVTESLAQIDVTLKNPSGVTVKYVIEKEENQELVQETDFIGSLTQTFSNLERGTRYIITVEAKNEYGTTKRKVTIQTMSLADLTDGKASFTITPNEKWQEEVTVKIESTYTEENTVLQYRIGEDGEWTDYSAEFKLTENTTLYGRYYDSVLEETGYAFTLNVEVIDDIGPKVLITDESVTSKTIEVTVSAIDEELGMPDTVEYKYYIGTDGENYTEKATSNTNTYKYEELSVSTTYYVKITVKDKKGNEGEIVKQISTSTPVLVSKITLDETEKTIGNSKTVQLNATIEPENAEDKTLRWETSNSNIATVSSEGIVTPKSEGTVTITCISNDGRVSDSCEITIVAGNLIYTREDLEAIELDLSGSYTLMADIDLSGEAWTSLASGYNQSFSGTLDGNGYTIKNLTNPLFTRISKATIKNLKIEDVAINNSSVAKQGIVVSNANDYNLICNVGVVRGSIQGKSYVGGIVGNNNTTNISKDAYDQMTNIKNCYVKDVTVTSNGGSAAGGIFGSYYPLYIENCYASNTVNGNYNWGPITTGGDKVTTVNSYYNSDLKTNSNVPETSGTPLETSEFANSSNFEGWDFENTWTIVDGYPELQIFVKDE